MQMTPNLNQWLKLDNPAAPEVRTPGMQPVADRRPVFESAIDKEMPWFGETGAKGRNVRGGRFSDAAE
jgi:hypothetical protein